MRRVLAALCGVLCCVTLAQAQGTGFRRPGVPAVKSLYWPAEALTADGTQCTTVAPAVINSGPTLGTIACADNDAGIISGRFTTPDSWDLGPITFEMVSYTSDATIAADDLFAFDVSCQVRDAGTTINNTWGTAVALDTTFITSSAYVEMHTTSGPVTCNGTATPGATIYWRIVVNATRLDASVDTQQARVTAVKVEYGIIKLSDN